MYLSPLPFAPPKNGQHARHTAAPKDSFEFRVCFERRQVKQKKEKKPNTRRIEMAIEGTT